VEELRDDSVVSIYFPGTGAGGVRANDVPIIAGAIIFFRRVVPDTSPPFMESSKPYAALTSSLVELSKPRLGAR
jgi:hypothetical protein